MLFGLNALIFKLTTRSAVLQTVVLLALELSLIAARVQAKHVSIIVVLWLSLACCATIAILWALLHALGLWKEREILKARQAEKARDDMDRILGRNGYA